MIPYGYEARCAQLCQTTFYLPSSQVNLNIHPLWLCLYLNSTVKEVCLVPRDVKALSVSSKPPNYELTKTIYDQIKTIFRQVNTIFEQAKTKKKQFKTSKLITFFFYFRNYYLTPKPPPRPHILLLRYLLLVLLFRILHPGPDFQLLQYQNCLFRVLQAAAVKFAVIKNQIRK